jgi:hypothetical protein
MGAWQRFWATVVIWAGVTATTIVLFAMQSSHTPRPFSEPMLLALVFIIIAGAVSATRAVWRAVREIAAQEKAAYATKAKRSHTRRIERLVNALDEDDVYDLEALLRERKQSHRN